MKIKEIHLDFTPLLDVTLIILFYFILFSNIGSHNAAEAEKMRSDAEALKQQADDRMAALEAADRDKAALAKALEEFGNGSNLSFIYTRTESGWELSVKRGDKTLSTFDQNSDVTNGMLTLLEDEGYGDDSCLLINFAYDSSEYLISARNSISPMFDAVTEKYSGRVFISSANTHREENKNEDQIQKKP